MLPQNDPHFYLTHISPLMPPFFYPLFNSIMRFLYLLCVNINLWLYPMTKVSQQSPQITITVSLLHMPSFVSLSLSHGLVQSFTMFTCFVRLAGLINYFATYLPYFHLYLQVHQFHISEHTNAQRHPYSNGDGKDANFMFNLICSLPVNSNLQFSDLRSGLRSKLIHNE